MKKLILLLLLTLLLTGAKVPELPTLPIDGVTRLTGWYWQQRSYGTHRALDIPAVVGTKIRACRGGIVVDQNYEYYRPSKGKECYGNYIMIEDSVGNTWLYAHLHSYNVRRGDHIKQGAVIGMVGWTGLSSCRPHLHLEKRDINGRKVIFTQDFGIVWSLG